MANINKVYKLHAPDMLGYCSKKTPISKLGKIIVRKNKRIVKNRQTIKS